MFIVWEWEWDHTSRTDGDSDSDTEYVPESPPVINPYIQSDTDSDEEVVPEIHTIRFKCIGVTHDSNGQEVLRAVSKKLRKGEQVPVRLVPEPDNQYDSKAIGFVCLVNGESYRIGYVVREALDHVHTALSHNKIMEVKFAWAQYLIQWSRSGPGFYAGIDITIRGTWHLDVRKCASTR